MSARLSEIPVVSLDGTRGLVHIPGFETRHFRDRPFDCHHVVVPKGPLGVCSMGYSSTRCVHAPNCCMVFVFQIRTNREIGISRPGLIRPRSKAVHLQSAYRPALFEFVPRSWWRSAQFNGSGSDIEQDRATWDAFPRSKAI